MQNFTGVEEHPWYGWGFTGSQGLIQIKDIDKRIFPSRRKGRAVPLTMQVTVNWENIGLRGDSIQKDTLYLSIEGSRSDTGTSYPALKFSDLDYFKREILVVGTPVLFRYDSVNSTSGYPMVWKACLMSNGVVLDTASIIIGIYSDQRDQRIQLITRLAIQEYETYMNVQGSFDGTLPWSVLQFWMEHLWKNNFYASARSKRAIEIPIPNFERIKETIGADDTLSKSSFIDGINWIADVNDIISKVNQKGKEVYPTLLSVISGDEAQKFLIPGTCIVRFMNHRNTVGIGAIGSNGKMVHGCFDTEHIAELYETLNSLRVMGFGIWVYNYDNRQWAESSFDKIKELLPGPRNKLEDGEVFGSSLLSYLRPPSITESSPVIPPSSPQVTESSEEGCRTLFIRRKGEDTWFEMFYPKKSSNTYPVLLELVSEYMGVEKETISKIFKIREGMLVRICTSMNIRRLEDGDKLMVE